MSGRHRNANAPNQPPNTTAINDVTADAPSLCEVLQGNDRRRSGIGETIWRRLNHTANQDSGVFTTTYRERGFSPHHLYPGQKIGSTEVRCTQGSSFQRGLSPRYSSWKHRTVRLQQAFAHCPKEQHAGKPRHATAGGIVRARLNAGRSTPQQMFPIFRGARRGRDVDGLAGMTSPFFFSRSANTGTKRNEVRHLQERKRALATV